MFKLEKRAFKSLPFFQALRFALSKRIRRIIRPIAKEYYAQTGEDIILGFLFEGRKEGTYVDVGCNHPVRGSNTFGLYMRGWSGVGIDAHPEICELFKRTRKRDVVVHRAISDSSGSETLYMSNFGHQVSTISEAIVSDRKNFWSYEKKIEVPSATLSEIINEYLPQDSSLDLLSIDIEGYDFIALRTLGLKKTRPSVILIETHSTSERDEISSYLKDFKYRLIYFAAMNSYYASDEWIESQSHRPFLGF